MGLWELVRQSKCAVAISEVLSDVGKGQRQGRGGGCDMRGARTNQSLWRYVGVHDDTVSVFHRHSYPPLAASKPPAVKTLVNCGRADTAMATAPD